MNIKSKLSVSLALLGAVSAVQSNDVSSHTFFYVRPVFQSCSPEKTVLFRDRALARECGLGGAFQIAPFGGQSTRSKELNKFFGPWPKDEFVVKETPDNNPNVSDRDINANLFNIRTDNQNFESTFKFKPRQTFAGVGFTHRQYLHCRDACEKKWWFEWNLPVVHVKNDMRISETVADNNNGGVAAGANASLEQAFKGANTVGGTDNPWKFGKIDGSQKRTGVADIELKLGYSYVDTDCCYFESYLGFQAPTSHRPKGVFVFEPLTGHNGHFAVMTGWATAFQLWSSCDGEKTLYSEIEFNSRYFISRTETRSFDLKEKPWSRYMPVYANAAAAATADPNNPTIGQTPGINVFTQELKVKPRFSHDINLGLVYNSCGFQGEIGWNYWSRQTELVELKNPWPTGNDAPAIPDCCNPHAIAGTPVTLVNTINRARNIRENFTAKCQPLAGNLCDSTECVPVLSCVATPFPNASTGDCTNCTAVNPPAVPWQTAYTPIREEDLNLNSAAHPAALSHTVYGSLGYRWDCWEYPPFAGVGGSYEFTGENTALNRWMVWGKIGFSY